MSKRITVLKLGGSVLVDERDVQRAMHEIYRFHREGDRVVAVVSAFHGTTDRLLTVGAAGGKVDASLAELLAGGERAAADALATALAHSGVPVERLDPEAVGLATRGLRFDADPIAVDREPFVRAFENGNVVVVPGFFGRSEAGGLALLGRGGSDLTALFLASELGAHRCRLIKDVPALFEWDPALAGPRPRAFASATFGTAERIGGKVLQSKAVAFARRSDLAFEVGNWNSTTPTTIGADRDRFFALPERRSRTVALLGCGTVNSAVRRELDALSDRFQLRRVLVRDLEKHAGDDLATTDSDAVFESCTPDLEICVEALGGEEPAAEHALKAIERGMAFVSANKTLIAHHGERLRAAADALGVAVLSSAAVGGSVPILETAARLRGRVVHFAGVLNGTTAFVLHELAHGRDLEGALARARTEGLAERDSTRDLDGTDAAEKLLLVARALGVENLELESIRRDHANLVVRTKRARKEGRRLIQIATLDATKPIPVASVLLREVDASSLFLDERSGDRLRPRPRPINVARFVRRDGSTVTLRGLGAGGKPTAISVVADLLELSRDLSASAEPYPDFTQRAAKAG